MRREAAALLLVLATALAGCSQVAAIAPVGGSRLAEVRFAANDVLVVQGVEVRTAPVCAQASDDTITCAGDTLDGVAITVTSPGGSADDLEVVVGADTIFHGSLRDVLEKAMDGS
jgi:hypothetical protein